jgi:hypothetical protein
MSTSYPGNPANIDPSAAFSITDPVDGDAGSAASVTTAFQKLADMTAFLRKGNNYPAARPTVFLREGWLFSGITLAAPIYAGSPWSTETSLAGTSTLTQAFGTSTSAFSVLTITPGSTVNNNLYVCLGDGTGNTGAVFDTGANGNFQYYSQEWVHTLSAVGNNKANYGMGLTKMGATANNLATANITGFAFKKETDTNWFAVTGTGAAETTTDTGLAPTAAKWNRFRIELYGSGTVKAAQTALFFVDDVLKATHTTNWPATTIVRPAFGGFRTTGGAGGNIQLGPVALFANSSVNDTSAREV